MNSDEIRKKHEELCDRYYEPFLSEDIFEMLEDVYGEEVIKKYQKSLRLLMSQ